ncbi:hypothetical protein [Vitiosangium sp. GDMCC 1.1324]|uniref:hypothetical protein n=1 Tax=Vitiosangium sp. (strain GDMCC 1.1324) TaxID=2138576 RepID=UPI000D3BA6A3|nr:hypothetical protein [Vitiosangium sp. GDMCC 1.1324]PTL77744.1 hypothetical protein DAT35_43825 [Vitiosangium sp. GDMCC 1.1324]
MGGNAFLLSVLYLVVGIGVEGARRVWPSILLQRLSLSLDSLPARALELVGLMQPLRDAYFAGRLSESVLRLVFGVTTIAIIFLLAVVVGVLMGSLRSFVLRRASRR